MKRKNFNKILIIIFLIMICFLLFYFFNKYFYKKEKNIENIQNEIKPEEEIPEENNYYTKIKLFLIDSSSGILTPEEITIDSRNLLDNPYKYVINLLINPPKETNLKSAIAEGTKINNCILNKGVLTVDFSKEFLNSSGTDAVYSVVNTLSEFNEIDSIKFKIDEKENPQLKEKFVKKE